MAEDKSTDFAPDPCIANRRFLGMPSAMPGLAKKIGENMKAARKERGLSLEKVAARCEPPTSYQQLSRLEKGDRSLTVEWIERVAKAIGVDPMDIIGGGPLAKNLSLSEPVAREMARRIAVVALEVDTPDPGTVEALSLMLQDLAEVFVTYPEAYTDLQVARPVIDLAARRVVRGTSAH